MKTEEKTLTKSPEAEEACCDAQKAESCCAPEAKSSCCGSTDAQKPPKSCKC